MLILAAIFVFIPLFIVVFRGLHTSQLIINILLSVVVAPIGALSGVLGVGLGGGVEDAVMGLVFLIIPFLHALACPVPNAET